MLAFRILSTFNNHHVTIRDGSDISSPVILDSDINVGYREVSNPLGTVVTTQERITVEMRQTSSYYYASDVKFELLSVIPGKVVL